jgi:hypothetical protein
VGRAEMAMSPVEGLAGDAVVAPRIEDIHDV